MSGSGPETTSKSEYPPEFRPIAAAAAQSIQAMQGVNPLAQYAAAQPGGTAGLSPFHRYAMAQIPGLSMASDPMWQLMRKYAPGSERNILPLSPEGLALADAPTPTHYASGEAPAPTQGPSTVEAAVAALLPIILGKVQGQGGQGAPPPLPASSYGSENGA